MSGNARAAEAWLGRVRRGTGPIYLALVEALEAAIREGELQPGDQLPPQRTVAERLGVDFTTVTRAYGAARGRGLVEGTVGRGTFVRSQADEDEAGRIDLSMNLPPPPLGLSLAGLLKATTAEVLERTDAATLMAYHPGAGTLGQKVAAAAWLAPVLGGIAPERLMVCAGAQAGLSAVMAAVAKPGQAVICEPLTYPGMIAIARAQRLRLVPCPVDGEGFEPEALARLCAAERPAAIYLIPTLQNPTATTMGEARRRAVCEAARRAGAWIVEDDPYSRLLDAPPPALAAIAPERTFHVATLSKAISPGLRIAFLAAPEGMGEAVAETLRAGSLMAAPLMSAVSARWIREGTAEALLAAVRREARARREIAGRLLPDARGGADGLHVWLDLPAQRPAEALMLAAQRRGLSLVAADAFAGGPDRPDGVRISLGGASKRAVLEQALGVVADLLAGPPERVVV